uniref:Pre-mRNA splicing factor component Cdc5p/Cef1 C-terminal domain-containing protein n=1 Tax=Anopheles funestus TaxID=62324 RepID=A0A1Y9HDY4_ANOFN
MVPVGSGTQPHVPGATPNFLRDKLNINTEDGLSVAETPAAYKSYQKQLKSSLKEGLASLPTPRNDYEIVVPDNETDEAADDGSMDVDQIVPDQADVDEKRKRNKLAQEAKELSLRSQVIQRDLPRPLEINTTVLRPSNEMHGLTDLQKAEEFVKQEMVKMLNYDALRNPIQQAQPSSIKRPMLAQYQAYLEQHPYENIDETELAEARKMLTAEMGVVKQGMAHGDLSLESYTQVWQECLSQVLYLPSQNRYTRANLASKKDRIESAEKRLEINRKHMAKEAKRCGKIEKKLKILTAGYQARAQALIKQFQETNEQIEQSLLALSTFQFLAAQEDLAIPKRLESLTDDVMRQTEREKALQTRYAQFIEELEELNRMMEAATANGVAYGKDNEQAAQMNGRHEPMEEEERDDSSVGANGENSRNGPEEEHEDVSKESVNSAATLTREQKNVENDGGQSSDAEDQPDEQEGNAQGSDSEEDAENSSEYPEPEEQQQEDERMEEDEDEETSDD